MVAITARALILLLLMGGWQVVIAADAAIVTEVQMDARDDAAEQAAMEASLIQALQTLTHNEGIAKTQAAQKLKQSLRDYLLEFEFTENGEDGDVTGAGKTEAALMLAHRLISTGHAEPDLQRICVCLQTGVNWCK